MAVQDGSPLETLQEQEEFPEKVSSVQDEKREKELTEALVEISERSLEEDQKSIDWLIGTGWEEAACGWGPVSATGCLHPQKKQKKPKPGEATDCILCLDLCFVPESKDKAAETKSGTVTDHEEKSATETSVVDHVLPPAEKDLASGFTGHCPSIESCNDRVSSVEVSSREARHKERNVQRSSSPLTGKAFPLCINCYNTKESLTFSAPLLLPPLKASPANGHAEQMARRKEVLLQQLEKLPSKGFLGSPLVGQVLHNIDLRVERKLLEAISNFPKEQQRAPEQISFVTSCVPKTPAKDVERLQWQNSFLVQKSLSVNTSNVKHGTTSAPVGFLHTRTMQNKRNVRQEGRPLGRRAKSGGSPVLSNPILPALTVTRVEIPVKVKMC
ncbi:uncharacterized protein C16orf46 homolog isoform 1-T7 [Anomaloglossus baeobatrachus]|uniref:uncharacterized protein C16orf46 homolog n=1 Tax=Anomaloglossus baeobatrachus TaxID=238106 RepID=UPI003F501398